MVTHPVSNGAKKLSSLLVRQGLAACVSQVPHVRSTYLWKNRLHHDKEVLLLIKTTTKAYRKLQTAILKLHPYENPEIIALTINRGSKAYLDWIELSVKAKHV